MEVHNRVPMCDITTFSIGGLLEEKGQFQGKMSRRSTRNIGKRVDYDWKVIKNSKEDDLKKEETNVSEKEDSDSQDNCPKRNLRKRLKDDMKEEIASESDDSEEDPVKVKRKDKFARVEDSNDEDYDPYKVSDDDSRDSGRKTQKSKKWEKPKMKQVLTEYEKMVEENRAEKMNFLKSLKFDEVKESLSEAVKSLKEKHKPVERKIKLWDLRKLQYQPIVEVKHHKGSVQSAYFSPLTGKHVLSTSNDDSICVFDSSTLEKGLLLQHSMPHNNFNRRMSKLTFCSTWLPNSDDSFVIGSILYPGTIEVYNSKMDNIFNFTNENLDCITSVNIFHPSLPVLAGASRGKVYVFTNEDVS